MEEFRMDKFWKAIEDTSQPDQEVEMFQVLFFENYTTLGEIREQFNSWSIEELELLLETNENTYTADDGVTENNHFGYRWAYSNHPLLEARFTDWCSSSMWKKTRPTKKRFF